MFLIITGQSRYVNSAASCYDTRMDFEAARIRARIISEVRRFFTQAGYLEVETPLLAPALIPEAHIEVFRTEYRHPFGEDTPLYLIPSPEVWMKRLLAAGSGSIFEICKSFRNAESVGEMHNPEFTMLEYYTVGADYFRSIDVTEQLFETLIARCGEQLLAYRRAHGLVDTLAAVAPPFERISVREAFIRYAGIDLEAAQTVPSLRARAGSIGITHVADDDWEVLFHRILIDRIEPNLPTGRPVVLYDYPRAIPTLAKGKGDTPWNERWELYVNGIELANCYSEETDPVTVRQFFADQTVSKETAMVAHRIDEAFPHLFESDFPECSGNAMGIDRLAMLLLGVKSIKRVLLYPTSGIIYY